MNETIDNTRALTKILVGIFGNQCWDDSAERTAERVLAYWESMSGPITVGASGEMAGFTTFPAIANQLIVVKDIDLVSTCAHHLLPFYGKAHIGYIPNKLMCGLSKIPRLVDYWATRPCTQEALTSNIASDLKHRLEAMGVAVIIEARHTCMACRGVRKHRGAMVTSEMRGVFLTASEARTEFLSVIGRSEI